MALEIDNALSKAQSDLAVARRREPAAASGLRVAIGSFLAPGRGGAPQTCPADLAAARNRAATLGDLLAETDNLAGEATLAAEQHADEARALKAQLESDRNPTGEK